MSVILIDSVFRAGKNYYPQVFVEECKYDDIKIFSDDSDAEEISNEEN